MNTQSRTNGYRCSVCQTQNQNLHIYCKRSNCPNGIEKNGPSAVDPAERRDDFVTVALTVAIFALLGAGILLFIV